MADDQKPFITLTQRTTKLRSGKSFVLVAGFLVRAVAAMAQGAPPPPDIVIPADRVERELAAGEALAVDVRDATAYGVGHLPGAVRLAMFSGECIAEGAACLQRELGRTGLTGSERLVLYGDDASGEALAHLFWLLEWAGLGDVRILDGGIAAWSEAGRTVETKARRLPARTFARPAGERIADISWVKDHFGLGGVEILDLRDSGIWMENGYEAPSHYAAGHIPHSLPYDFRLWLPRGGRWPPAWRIKSALGELGPRASTFIDVEAELVLYAEGPDDPALGPGYLSLRRVGIPVRVFPGGFAAWLEGHNPVVRIVGAKEVRELLERENPGLAEDRPGRSGVLLDLREDWDFRHSHIPGSFNLPAYSGFVASLEKLVQERWPDAPRTELPLIFYCYGRGCIRSREGSTQAARLGFTQLLWFRDGLDAWNASSFPLTSPPPRTSLPGSPR